MTWTTNKPLRLRFLINAVDDPVGISYQLEHRINAGAWGATGTAAGVAVRIYPSSNIAASAATATTSQLTGGSGSFTAGRISDDTSALPSIDIGSGGNTELEWCIYVDSVYLVGGRSSTVEWRVTKAGVALDSYTQTPSATFLGYESGYPVEEYPTTTFDWSAAGWFSNDIEKATLFDSSLLPNQIAAAGGFKAAWARQPSRIIGAGMR